MKKVEGVRDEWCFIGNVRCEFCAKWGWKSVAVKKTTTEGGREWDGEKGRSFSLETDLRKFITQKTQPSTHEKACKEYGMMEAHSTEGKVAEGWDRNEMKLKYDFVLFIFYFFQTRIFQHSALSSLTLLFFCLKLTLNILHWRRQNIPNSERSV